MSSPRSNLSYANSSPASSFSQLAFIGKAIVNDRKQRKQKQYLPVVSSCQEILPKILKADEVLVKVTRASICQTDRRVLARQKKQSLSEKTICLGHEGGGRVVVSATELASEFKTGQKVVFLPHYSCMKCFQCRRGNTNLCPQMKHMGIHTPGVFSHFIAQPARCLYSLPETFDEDLIPLIEPLSCAMRGWSRMGKPNGPVAIYGAGPMGLLLALSVKRLYPGTSVELIEINKTRAKAVFQATGIRTLRKPRKQVQVAVIACSEMQAYELGIQSVRAGGRVMAFSGINLQDLNSEKAKHFEAIHREELKETLAGSQIEMVGTSGYNKSDIAKSVRELSRYGKHYQKVQNSTLEGLMSRSLKMKDGKILHRNKPAMVELLQTDSELRQSKLQASVLKLLIKMDQP